MSDFDEYLRPILAGDVNAFGQWMAGAEPRVRDSLRSFAALVDTEAVVQEAFLCVWQVAPRFVADGRPDGLLRLALRIARNLAVSERRRTRASGADDDALERALAGDIEFAARAPTDPLLRRVIETCRDALPRKPGLALTARLASGGAEADDVLAMSLGMTRNTFLQNFTRARKLLFACLERHGVDLGLELA
jgi:DNA-directed RNA polymerase specialized sigma24 family protein